MASPNYYSNNNTVNELPEETIRMQYRNFVDPEFWRENEGDYNYSQPGTMVVNGKLISNATLIKDLGLEVSNNENDFSDPGVGDMPDSNENTEIRRTSAYRNNTTRTKRKVSPPKKKSKAKTKKQNNRFGFKKAFGALGKSIKKLTGRSRRRRA
jgi:hypothetical protein